MLITKHILSDPLADLLIANIRRADLLDLRDRLLRKAGQSTVNNVMGILKIVFREGYFREELDRNPTEGIGVIKYQKREAGIFTLDELGRLFLEEPTPWQDRIDYTCFFLTASTGMRRGEVLSLRWRCLDLEQGIARVDAAFKGSQEIGLPKWENTRITPFILFPAELLEALRKYHEDSIRIHSDDFVFCYDDGTRLGNTWWRTRFNTAVEKLGLGRVKRNLTPHSFRHTLNTLLRDRGKDSAKIREVLGWQQERTQDRYTHFDIEHFKDLIVD
jgi:integrase